MQTKHKIDSPYAQVRNALFFARLHAPLRRPRGSFLARPAAGHARAPPVHCSCGARLGPGRAPCCVLSAFQERVSWFFFTGLYFLLAEPRGSKESPQIAIFALPLLLLLLLMTSPFRMPHPNICSGCSSSVRPSMRKPIRKIAVFHLSSVTYSPCTKNTNTSERKTMAWQTPRYTVIHRASREKNLEVSLSPTCIPQEQRSWD